MLIIPQTSTFVFDSADHGARLFAGEQAGHIYTRMGNPTVEEFEKVIKVLEKGALGVAFGSGMGVVTGCVFPFLNKGDHVIICDTGYGLLRIVWCGVVWERGSINCF